MTQMLQFDLVTPAKLAVSESVEMVEIPGEEGDFGVLPGHMPFLSMIRPGVIRVHHHGALQQFFVGGGYAEVNPEGCTVIAENVREMATLTREDVAMELAQARKAISDAQSDAARERAERDLRAAEALEASFAVC